MTAPVFRCDEVTEILNGFRVWEYEYGTDLINGRVYSYAEQTGLLDACLTDALTWAASEPDVIATRTADGGDGDAEVELADGTVIVWSAGEKQWAVTVADGPDPAHSVKLAWFNGDATRGFTCTCGETFDGLPPAEYDLLTTEHGQAVAGDVFAEDVAS